MKKNSKYIISDYSKKQAKRLNVIIKPSENAKKKIDVYNQNGLRIAQIGCIFNHDFPYYLKHETLEYAKERQRLYLNRHMKDIHNKNGNGYYSAQILW